MRKFTQSGLVFMLALGSAFVCLAEEDVRTREHRKLDFLVGEWEIAFAFDGGEENAPVIHGEATIEWAVGDSWLRHEFQVEFPGNNRAFVKLMMNYSPPKEMYNMYMFDHFGGEAGIFYGGWNDSGEVALTAQFTEEDGSSSHQRLVFRPVGKDEFHLERLFSDDGKQFQSGMKAVYRRRK